MGKRKNTAPQRKCVWCSRFYSAKLRYKSISRTDHPELFEDGRYIGNEKVKSSSWNYVQLDKPFYWFKDGNFCTARCAGTYANRMTGASYCINHDGTEASWVWE